MKNQIILFAIGVLVGAIISTGSFYVYASNIKSSNNNQMNGGQSQMMPNSNRQQFGMGQPPEKHGDNNGQSFEMPNEQQPNASQTSE